MFEREAIEAPDSLPLLDACKQVLDLLEIRRRRERPSSNGSKHFSEAIVLRNGDLRRPHAQQNKRGGGSARESPTLVQPLISHPAAISCMRPHSAPSESAAKLRCCPFLSFLMFKMSRPGVPRALPALRWRCNSSQDPTGVTGAFHQVADSGIVEGTTLPNSIVCTSLLRPLCC